MYEWLVLHFRMPNAPSTSMRVGKYGLRPFVGRFLVFYYEDVQISGQLKEEHLACAKFKKYSFIQTLSLFEGFIVYY